jgi:hypothetical protein
MAVRGAVIHWVAQHRAHHTFADEDGDPHSPHTTGVPSAPLEPSSRSIAVSRLSCRVLCGPRVSGARRVGSLPSGWSIDSVRRSGIHVRTPDPADSGPPSRRRRDRVRHRTRLADRPLRLRRRTPKHRPPDSESPVHTPPQLPRRPHPRPPLSARGLRIPAKRLSRNPHRRRPACRKEQKRHLDPDSFPETRGAHAQVWPQRQSSRKETKMDVVVDRCAGLHVPRDNVVATMRTPGDSLSRCLSLAGRLDRPTRGSDWLRLAK